ncbi:MAG: chemotaxis protein CheC [Pseudomonadota bacterium]
MNMHLSQDQADTLQELTNIAMGQAGSSLAQILNVFVELSIPQIRVVEAGKILPAIAAMIPEHEQVTAVRQAFYNRDQLRGEAISIFTQAGCSELATCMGYDSELAPREEQELLLDVSNILSGAVLNGLAQQLATDLGYSAPSIMAEQCSIDKVITPENMTWNYALMVGIDFGIENKTFKCHQLILMAEESIKVLAQALDHFLESF